MKKIYERASKLMASKLITKLQRTNELGATMVEYGLLIGLIAIACAAILTSLGTDLSSVFTSADTGVKTAGS